MGGVSVLPVDAFRTSGKVIDSLVTRLFHELEGVASQMDKR